MGNPYRDYLTSLKRLHNPYWVYVNTYALCIMNHMCLCKVKHSGFPTRPWWAYSALQHPPHCEEVSAGGGAGAGGASRWPGGSCTEGRQWPQVHEQISSKHHGIIQIGHVLSVESQIVLSKHSCSHSVLKFDLFLYNVNKQLSSGTVHMTEAKAEVP